MADLPRRLISAICDLEHEQIDSEASRPSFLSTFDGKSSVTFALFQLWIINQGSVSRTA